MFPERGVTPHPGEMLLEEYLQPMGISPSVFGRYIGLDRVSFAALIHGKRNITPTLAIKIGMALGMSPEFWSNLQAMHDLTRTREKLRIKRKLPKITPLPEVREAVKVVDELRETEYMSSHGK